MSVYCDCGCRFPDLDNQPGKPCGLVMYEIARTKKKNLPVLVCRRCDGLPKK